MILIHSLNVNSPVPSLLKRAYFLFVFLLTRRSLTVQHNVAVRAVKHPGAISIFQTTH